MIETITISTVTTAALIIGICTVAYLIWKDSRKKYRTRYDWKSDSWGVYYEDEFGERRSHSAFLTKERAEHYCKELNKQS